MDQNKTISIRCEGQEYHDIEDLIPFQGKLKSISSDNFHKLKESIKSDGIPLGFHIWKQKDKTYIMDGHHRKMALQALKDEGYFIPPVPCNIVIAKTKKEAAKIVLISNSKYSRVSEESLSDYMIDMELKVEDLENLDIPELNMDDFEPEQESKDGLTDDDAVPEVDQNIHGVTLGDIYQLGNHRLMCGDSTSIDTVEKLMDGQNADMVFTDPPYNQPESGGKNDSIGKSLHKQTSSIAHLINFEPDNFLNILPTVFHKSLNAYVFTSKDLLPDYLQWAKNAGFAFNVLVWKKPTAIPIGGSHRPDVEYLLTFRKSGIFNSGILNVNYSKLIECKRDNAGLHPTMKPIEIIENQLKIGSNETSIVVDLFGGSGSTLIACEKTNRKCFMMELDPHYCSVIIERWQQFTGQKAVKLDAKMMR